MADKYFATLETDEIARKIYDRCERYYDYLSSSGTWQSWKGIYDAYYAGEQLASEISKAGDSGELQQIGVNHLHNLIDHQHILTTQQEPGFNCIASNTDTKSQKDARLGNQLLEYYNREKRLTRHAKKAVKHAALAGEGFVTSTWNSTAGKPAGVNPETGQVVNEGDANYSSYGPLDVPRDVTKGSWAEHTWNMVRRFENRFDLIAKNPELEDRIMAVGDKYSEAQTQRFMRQPSKDYESDDVIVFDFYHDRTPAVPQGRMVSIVGPECVLLDGPLPYKKRPVHRISAGDQEETIFGYTLAYDIYPLQQAINGLYSVILTNQSAFGVQNILIPNGCTISVKELIGGLNAIKWQGGTTPPQPLNLTSTPKEVFEFVQMLEHAAETLSGVNSLARGNVPENVKSGAFGALLESMAVRFNSGLQQSYFDVVGDVGQATIEILQQYATTKRVVVLAGKANRSAAKTFSGDDLKGISSVTVEVGNALQQTLGGKMEIADKLLERNLIKDVNQYFEVLESGRLQPVTEGPVTEQDNIRSENERLAEGQPVSVVATDMHPLHISHHKSVLDSPEAREDANIVSGTLQHIADHISQWSGMTPQYLAALGLPPLPPNVPQMPGADGMSATQPPMAGDPSATPPPEGGEMSDTIGQAAEPLPNMPNLPTNPLTGQEAQVPQAAPAG